MSPYPAIRRNGVCTGSLWKSHSRCNGGSNGNGVSSSSTSSSINRQQDTSFSLDGILAEANERQRTHEFCVLVGNTLWSYSDVWAYTKGDSPTSEIRIVGASAWNPPSMGSRIPNGFRKPDSSTTTTSSSSGIPTLASEAGSKHGSSSKSADFLIVSYSGTHVHCSAPTPLDKDKWLEALHAGLEGNIIENRVEALIVLSKHYKELAPLAVGQQTRQKCHGLKHTIKSDMMVQSAVSLAMKAFQAEISFRSFVPPIPRVEVCSTNNNNTNLLSNGEVNSPTKNRTGYHSPCDDVSAPPSDTHCTACGRYPPAHAMRIDAAPLLEYGLEVRVDLCHDCCIAQGVLGHVRYLNWLYEVEASDRAAIRKAWLEVQEVLDRLKWENDGLTRGKLECDFPTTAIEPAMDEGETEAGDTKSDVESALLDLVSTEQFSVYRQRSATLDSICELLELGGFGSASNFLENISECAQAAGSSCLCEKEHEKEDESGTKEKISLKKEAFKVAGDMSTALKLLYEYALPPERQQLPHKSQRSDIHLRENADMLAAILEFFLDLCEEGQLDTVAFFWPQLCHIHMQMLPPRDTEEMIRVELMEDFLLTVATRHSVHLALNLVWGLTADLEESLGSLNCNSLSRRRRFAILRFVSELESLLFDFEGGWGGGGVSLHGMLSPSQHQAAFLSDAMSLLQLRRRFGSHHLTRSVRLDKLRAEAMEPLMDSPPETDDTVARNAAYFSSHITFARKLGDIAEKLRFEEIEQRSSLLKSELKKINASGNMFGGDPLNRLCYDGQLQKTVHIPPNEGHVFRSKERTPVLLLVEVVEDTDSKMIQNDVTEATKENTVYDYEQTNHNSPQRSISPTTPEQTCDQDESKVEIEAEIDTCPESPSPAQVIGNRKEIHRVLALTPRASETTSVTDEGKEMMADMIATLIDNQTNRLRTPSHEYNDSDASGYNGEVKEPCESIIVKPCHDDMKEPSAMASVDDARKISALGSVFPPVSTNSTTRIPGIHLTADGQFRRDVLFAIMERGMRGSNVIARGAGTAARHAMQAMDRKRAIALMNESVAETEKSGIEVSDDGSSRSTANASIDECEVMEALRLLIIQNQAAQENLSAGNDFDMISNRHDPNPNGVDAGEVDDRLAGCGRISSSVLSALRLWKGGIVSNGEILELVQKDLEFLKQSAVFGSADEKKLIEDSAFWGRFSFGERWAEKKARCQASSPHGCLPGWNLVGCIVKSNDDLRQEAFVMQLIRLCEEAFQTAGIDLWVQPYNIVATGLSTGIIECVRNAMSFDSLKKRPGYGTDGLVGHFERMTEIAVDPQAALDDAKQNFVRSLAAYSLMSYLFMFKDRHNGNLLLDTAGHVIHIDFGFVFGIAPGGSFSLEQSTPFKLTDEMLEVMGGLGSPLFSEFVTLFCCGFLALQAHADTFLTVVEVTCRGSNFHCFDGKDPGEVVAKLRERFCPMLSKSQTVAYALDLIKFATTSYGTKQYDYFQYLSQGIAT